MATGAIVGVTVQGADQGDTTTIAETVTAAAEALEAVAAATDGHTAVMGYGNDSRQTGPLSSRFLHITCPTGVRLLLTKAISTTHAEATHRPPEVAHEAGFFSVFCDVPVSGLVSAKANRPPMRKRIETFGSGRPVLLFTTRSCNVRLLVCPSAACSEDARVLSCCVSRCVVA